VIYFARQPRTDLVKIGYTYGDPARRLAALQTGHADPLHLMGAADGDEAAERDWHARFAASRVRREWFRLTPPLARAVALANPALREFFAFFPVALVVAGERACRVPAGGACGCAFDPEYAAALAAACRQVQASDTPALGPPPWPPDAERQHLSAVGLVEAALRRLDHPCPAPVCLAGRPG
jgi:hypothetical protein